MSKSRTDKKYKELKASFQERAKSIEKELHEDLLAVRHEYVPHHLKRKFLTGLGIFGTVYLAEKLLFGKRIPRIIRFTTSLSAIVLAPKVYRLIEDKILSFGALDPNELELLEDQQLDNEPFSGETTHESADSVTTPDPATGMMAAESTSEETISSEDPETDTDAQAEGPNNSQDTSEEEKPKNDPYQP